MGDEESLVPVQHTGEAGRQRDSRRTVNSLVDCAVMDLAGLRASEMNLLKDEDENARTWWRIKASDVEVSNMKLQRQAARAVRALRLQLLKHQQQGRAGGGEDSEFEAVREEDEGEGKENDGQRANEGAREAKGEYVVVERQGKLIAVPVVTTEEKGPAVAEEEK